MKVLVGLACAAIIAFVGYFFWGEWQRSETTRQVEVAFIQDCHRSWGEFNKRMETSITIADDQPGLLKSLDDCSAKLGQEWSKTDDTGLLAAQSEGAGRVK